MNMMKVGTRLTLVLLLALTPVLVSYMYWSVRRSSVVYVHDLKRDIRATTRSLAPALENDLLLKEWNEVDDVLRRMTDDTTRVAVLNRDGSLWKTSDRATAEIVEQLLRAKPSGDAEFETWIGETNWFCRVVPLNGREGHEGNTFAYLLVAQDWTDIREDLKERTAISALAAFAVIGVIVALIPLLVRRSVSSPLAELSRRVMRFSEDEQRDRHSPTNEVSLLTEEFRRLDDQLTVARRDLLAKHRRELELERRLQHAERLATVGTLASGLAHEIGTPMGVIRGRAEQLLHSEPSPNKARRGLEIIVSQIDRVSRIVRMLLDYGRSRESHRAVCDLRQIVNHAMSLMETEAARRRVTVSVELGDQPLLAECDAGQLQQVFVNLEMNALDAMTPQGGTLRIRAESGVNGNGRELKIVFEDTGHGVSPLNAGRVFDPFFTTKETGGGTGMGLAVSQSIIRDHRGEITFESGPDGSKFLVAVPGVPVGKVGEAPAKETHV
jgi:two-component system, NtrC family, sensor kinase